MTLAPRDIKHQYEQEVKEAFDLYYKDAPDSLSEKDISNLPEVVQKYIRYVGAIGKPKVWNFRIEMKGKMWRDGNSRPMQIDSVQYNFTENSVRMFKIKGSMLRVPIHGLHAYKNEEGTMRIKILGLFPIVDAKGKEMNESDTVTVLNDMCVFAPATLIDSRINWEVLDKLTVKATFTNGKNIISATLLFNDTGQLVNFISDDRYRINGNIEKLRWSTPIRIYQNFGGFNLSAKASTVWHEAKKEFMYGDFDVASVEYNVTHLK